MKKVIFSKRGHELWPSYQIVYEWEDVMAESMKDTSLSVESKFRYYVYLLVRKLKLVPWSNLLATKKVFVQFDMSTKTIPDLCNRRNVVPIIIDFFFKDSDDIAKFVRCYNKNALVLISSKEAYEFLKQQHVGLNIEHLALSIADKYRIKGEEVFDKPYDFVLLGRQNAVLRQYLERYAKEHPDLVYVERDADSFNYRTNHGECLGSFESRDAYMELMRKAKIALYSTPSMDNSRLGTNGYNQVTPRFLEYIACGCHLIMRYPKNPDTEFYHLSAFGKSVESYSEFAALVDWYRKSSPDMKFYADYLSNHYTSCRAEALEERLSRLFSK